MCKTVNTNFQSKRKGYLEAQLDVVSDFDNIFTAIYNLFT